MNLEPRKGSEESAALPPRRAPQLLFCAVCHVSISAAELARGDAQTTPRGRTFCGVCARATPEERTRRRATLEAEFADDAPVPQPVREKKRKAAPAKAAAHGTAERRAAPASAAAQEAPAPPSAPAAPQDAAILEARVGALERANFKLRARVTFLEERLQELMQRLP
jgi:hypothetical protein